MSVQWQKSSFSGAGGEECVELGREEGRILLRESDAPDTVIATTPARLNALVRWQKSSYSGAGDEDCVELACCKGGLLLRESDSPGEVLAISPTELGALIRRVGSACGERTGVLGAEPMR